MKRRLRLPVVCAGMLCSAQSAPNNEAVPGNGMEAGARAWGVCLKQKVARYAPQPSSAADVAAAAIGACLQEEAAAKDAAVREHGRDIANRIWSDGRVTQREMVMSFVFEARERSVK